jgi:glucan biosynthesis protein
MGFRRRVRMFSLDAATQQAREIHFRPEYPGAPAQVL